MTKRPKPTQARSPAANRVSGNGGAAIAGQFITLEGGEGTGKSTQAELLRARLEAAGIEAIVTREPGGSPGAELIRQLLLDGAAEPFGPTVETALFFAARADHLKSTIEPALGAGTWVICDRFTDSTRAYQGQTAPDVARFIDELDKAVVGDTQPDVTILLDLPAMEGLKRARAQSGEGAEHDRFEARDLTYHEMVRQTFLDIAANAPERCLTVEAAGTPEEVADEIWRLVSERFGLTSDNAEAKSGAKPEAMSKAGAKATATTS